VAAALALLVAQETVLALAVLEVLAFVQQSLGNVYFLLAVVAALGLTKMELAVRVAAMEPHLQSL
jgi:hypothetical protein